MAKRWLIKSDPAEYGYDDLEREGETIWDGVRNALALTNLGAMRPGDQVFVYHTGRERAIVGIAEVTGGPGPGPVGSRAPVVRLAARARLPRPVPLAALRGEAALADWDLLRLPRLSVVPVPSAAWRRVNALSRG